MEKAPFPGGCGLAGMLGPRSGLSLATKAVAPQLRVWPAGFLSDSPRAGPGLSPLAREGREAAGTMWPLFSHRPGSRQVGTQRLHRALGQPTSPGCGHGHQGLGTRLLQDLQGQSLAGWEGGRVGGWEGGGSDGRERWKENRKERERREKGKTHRRGEQREKNKVGERNKKIQKEIGARGGEERRGIEGKKRSREERKRRREGGDWEGEEKERINGERRREKKE